ncbi:TetR/AcrR family transcriptional regulator [Streptomyces sp. Agncl-13]|uniref:TetR/AcrR family transcriptional regulator n=1 Tax=Streptomyces sp. Agncl-13 TaxID=3400628 RepID=UPI003A88847E
MKHLDRERIVTAAVRLLDAEGEARFSMRRLASELEVTAMSLYWYVDTKDDLLELALDAVTGRMELPDPADAGRDWQDDLHALALAWRRAMIARPWALHCYGRFPHPGPHGLRFSEHVQAVLARSPLPDALRPTALSAVLRFLFGSASLEGRWTAPGRQPHDQEAEQDFHRGLGWLLSGMGMDASVRDRRR